MSPGHVTVTPLSLEVLVQLLLVIEKVFRRISEHVLEAKSFSDNEADLTVCPVARGQVLQQQHKALWQRRTGGVGAGQRWSGGGTNGKKVGRGWEGISESRENIL